MEAPPKPLNVLVFTGETSENCERFRNIASLLKFCLHPEYYLVYLLTPVQATKDPWHDNLKLLLISADSVEREVADAFGKYALGGGNVYVSCCDLTLPDLGLTSRKPPSPTVLTVSYLQHCDVSLWQGVRYEISCPHTAIASDSCSRGVVFKLLGRNVIVSEVCLERDPSSLTCSQSEFDTLALTNSKRIDAFKDILSKEFSMNCSNIILPDLTPCYLFASGDIVAGNIVAKMESNENLELLPVDCLHSKSVPTASEKCLPVVYNFQTVDIHVPFNFSTYVSFLKSSTFGRTIFFIPVVGSTMDIIPHLSRIEGSCVAAGQQVGAKGRGSNKWISPVGSASFSLHFSLSLSSKLGQHLPLIQHMVAVSVVHAVRKTPGYEDIDLRLKWPNDIYYGSKVKIGGILATTSVVGTIAKIFTGCGVNVSNSCPTLCINDVIQFHNSQFGCELAPFSTEQLIASSLSELEQLIIDYQASGSGSFLKLYYKYWLHANQRVTLKVTEEEVTVVGLNEYGFLVVKERSGNELSLFPDGNSFDILKNLIVAK